MFTDLLARLSTRKPKEVLPQQGLLYFDHLYGEYQALRAGHPSLIPTTEAEAVIEEANRKRKNHSLTWNDLYAVDLILTRLQPVEKLSRRIWSLRGRYRDVAGAKEYDAYLASKPPESMQTDSTTDREAQLLADAEYLLSELYLRYAISPVREKVRDEITQRIAVATLVWLSVALFFTFVAGRPDGSLSLFGWMISVHASTLTVVIFVGALGGLVSMQQRYQSLPEEGDAIHSVSELIKGWLSIFMPAISGAVFAAILYLLVLAGLLKGGLFPTMAPEDRLAKGISFLEFLRQANPETGTEFSKLLVWSFIAGFAERFIPDTLSRFVAQRQADAAKA